MTKTNLFQGSEKLAHGPERGLRLSGRDNEILDALTHRVRVFSLSQIARTWWSVGKTKEAKHRLQTLQAAGLVHLYSVVSHPEIPLAQPAYSWRVGEQEPDLGKISYRLKARWNLAPISTECVIATALCGRSRGGSGGRFPRESEQVHDLHLAAVFLLHHRQAKAWRSEASLLRARCGIKGEKLPDAIVERNGSETIVEFGGAYSKRKLEDFHDYCQSIETNYEVW